MAPLRAAATASHEPAMENDTQQSQDPAPGEVNKLIDTMHQATRDRQATKRADIEKKRIQATESAGIALDKADKDYQQKLAELRESEIDRFQNLLLREDETENEIMKRLRVVEEAYDAASQEMDAAVHARIEELNAAT